ncbi:MAG: type II toxin-antitoxin system RelE/ParE family toxin [Gammaproteobacteria bacterium]
MPVIFSVQAEQDLEEIGDHIAIDNPSRAVSFVREIREHCAKISSSPLGYTLRPDLGERIRSCSHGRYLILFQSSGADVLIVRVLHGARDQPALL